MNSKALLLLAALVGSAAAEAMNPPTYVANLFKPALNLLPRLVGGKRSVKTPLGELSGLSAVYSREGGVFLGIPYAQPPVGDLRWRPPAPATPWEGVRVADKEGNVCPQGHADVPMHEDCLYLNVFTPRIPDADDDEDAELLPVMMFIHGGSFVSGSGLSQASGVPIYDGNYMSAHGNVVVVSINYRLGALGFLATPELLQEENVEGAASSVHTTGNYGVQDQREAMRWVKANIAAFGGDANRLTIFGESAGAMSVIHQIISPPSAGHFEQAIAESGNEEAFTLEEAYEGAKVFVDSLACSGKSGAELMSCLRGLPWETVLHAAAIKQLQQVRWSPTIDGYELSDAPAKLMAAGKFNKLPVMIGTNRNEAAIFECSHNATMTPVEYMQLVGDYFSFLGDGVPELLYDAYRPEHYESPRDAFIDMATDIFFTCSTRHVARSVAAAGQPSYRYLLLHAPNVFVLSAPKWGNWPKSYCLKVPHTADLFFVFADQFWPLFSPSEVALSKFMSSAWTTFAHTGAPTADGEWPAYDDKDPVFGLDLSSHVVPGFKNDKCDLIDKLLLDADPVVGARRPASPLTMMQRTL